MTGVCVVCVWCVCSVCVCGVCVWCVCVWCVCGVCVCVVCVCGGPGVDALLGKESHFVSCEYMLHVSSYAVD